MPSGTPSSQVKTGRVHLARMYGELPRCREGRSREARSAAGQRQLSKPGATVYLFVVIVVYAVIITAAQMPG
ncbi:hypothetical protein OG705_29420 [Streptomyces sp. NBC_00838]|uniref:hypothetical protein n=1 Tax=Streptomyces sp. NBC_00838 TaxID=2903680 RepID=UPI00386EFFFB|nr:hypothetical protein OG705_29420 [Streptomyces sp. NBC_00838]